MIHEQCVVAAILQKAQPIRYSEKGVALDLIA
ncbi:unannotated protein [freshwater metagenome]|uniref:Unannotated protein n=1 Tax=freshwater metagenome TaxID=449393 RepID=A0A6J7HGY5_9ZZZZ